MYEYEPFKTEKAGSAAFRLGATYPASLAVSEAGAPFKELVAVPAPLLPSNFDPKFISSIPGTTGLTGLW